MKNFCNHFGALKVEKIGNLIRKSSLKCTAGKHQDSEYSLCLHCGQSRCNRDNECSKNHADSNKHPLILKLLACYVYCWACDVQIQSMIEDMKSDDLPAAKFEKLEVLYAKIRELAIKNLIAISPEEKQLKQPSHREHPDKRDSMPELRTFGLVNIGNTCYFNSVLQCLFSTAKIHEFYSAASFKDEFNISFRKFLANTQKVYSAKTLFSLLARNFKFLKGMGQQDAFELYVLLIDSLIESASSHQNLPSKLKIGNSIGSIFGFQCFSRLHCLSCGQISWTKDFHLGLTVPLLKANHQAIELPIGSQISQEEIGQEGLCYPNAHDSNTFLDNFFGAEMLQKSNSYRCQKCGQSSGIKKFYFQSPPSVLTINFKRFNNGGKKVNSHISVPEQISLNPHCLRRDDFTYELYAGVTHSGSSGGGHYVAYTRRNEKWYYFSDTHVKPCSLGAFRDSNPYILFYRRVQPGDISAEQMGKQSGKTGKKSTSIEFSVQEYKVEAGQSSV